MHLMSEENYMSKEINAEIIKENEKVYLSFNFDTPIKIEFTSSDSEEIKNVFIEILNYILEEEDVIFKFDKKDEDLFNEIADKYISELNNELKTLKEKYYKNELFEKKEQ